MNYPTGSDLNNESIVPVFGDRKKPDIGRVAVMASCEPDFRYIRSRAVKSSYSPFFTSTLITPGERDQGISVAGPFIGAPYAVMLLESLIAKGADKILLLGWCGAVTDQINVGDILLPSKAIVEEGTSGSYKILEGETPYSEPDPVLLNQFSDHLQSSGIEFQKPVIWTTDAIYRETEKKVSYYRERGAMAVEMEFSALFSVAEYRKVQIAGLLVVSDSVASKDWDSGFRKKQFKDARKRACKAVMSFADKICE